VKSNPDQTPAMDAPIGGRWGGLGMSELMKRRGEVEKKLEAAEAAWLEAKTVEA